jgi:hypothetical protein
MSKTIVRCESTTTFSSIVGSLTSFASSFFINNFPKGFFKKVFISESLNSTNMDDDKDVQKYSTPYLVIKPEMAMDNTYMEVLPYWYNAYHYIAEGSRRKEYYPIIQDHDNGIYIYSIPTRMKVNFDVRIKVPTTMFMYNTLHAIQTKFETGGFNYINNVRMQTEVPKVMMINLAETLGYNLDNMEEREKFNEYIAENSLNGIEENINLSTGNNNYAFNFVSNILVNYPSNAQGDKNIKNLVVDNTIVSFEFSMELWIPNRYILELPNNRQELTQEFENSEDAEKFKFNIVVNKDYILPKIDNKHLIKRKSFLPDVNVEYDELNFSPIINQEVKDVVNVLIDKKLFREDLFEVLVMCGNKHLPKSEYEVDYKNMILKTKRPMSNTTYTILVYGYLDKLNYVSNLLHKKELDKLEGI